MTVRQHSVPTVTGILDTVSTVNSIPVFNSAAYAIKNSSVSVSNDGQVLSGDGDNTKPSYSFGAHTNTGFYYNTGNSTVNFSTAGTDRFIISDSATTITGDLIVNGTTTTINSTP